MLDSIASRGDSLVIKNRSRFSRATAYPLIMNRLRCFPEDEQGTQAMEVLMIFVAIVVPCFSAVLMLQEVLFEYLEVTTLIVTSPFF